MATPSTSLGLGDARERAPNARPERAPVAQPQQAWVHYGGWLLRVARSSPLPAGLYNVLSAVDAPPREPVMRVWRARAVDLCADNLCCVSSATACWAYDRLFCEPPMCERWPKALRDLVAQCIASEPSERPDATEVVVRLEEVEKA